MKTLEFLTANVKEATDEQTLRKIHTASMLALVQASHAVLNQTTMPTPLYRLSYDEQNHSVEFKILDGYAAVPQANSLDISMLDMLLASLFREKMPILFEGKTGTGKTYTTEQFLKTILPSENYRGLRLNANMTNVLQPYTEGYVEQGLVKIRLKREELGNVAALFIDEVNRGDTNQVLQLQDGTITLSSGERGELGLPIPDYSDGKWTKGEHKRPVYVVSAQNPPATKDAKYSHTRRGDAAQVNRNLQISVPNSATSIGASTLLLSSGNGQHKHFRELYRKELGKNLGVTPDAIGNLDDWISVYAFTTDPRRTECPSLQSSAEFIDAMLNMTAPSLTTAFQKEQQITEHWQNTLQGYGVDFKYAATLDELAQPVMKVKEVVKSFEEEIITRDIIKVKKLSDATSMIRRIKKALATDDPVGAYLQMPSFITVQDVACGFAIMLHDKQETHEKDPVTVVDQVLKEYTNIVEDFARNIGYAKPFSADDPQMSLYGLAFQHAIAATDKGILGSLTGMFGSKTQIPAFIKDLGASVAQLKRMDQGIEIRKPIIARIIADVTTLAGFADQYGTELESLFERHPTAKRQAIKDLYVQKRDLVSTPSIYLHRLTRVLGV